MSRDAQAHMAAFTESQGHSPLNAGKPISCDLGSSADSSISASRHATLIEILSCNGDPGNVASLSMTLQMGGFLGGGGGGSEEVQGHHCKPCLCWSDHQQLRSAAHLGIAVPAGGGSEGATIISHQSCAGPTRHLSCNPPSPKQQA